MRKFTRQMGSKSACRKRGPGPLAAPAASLRALLAAASIGLYSGWSPAQESEATAALEPGATAVQGAEATAAQDAEQSVQDAEQTAAALAERAASVLAEIPQPRHLAAALADPDSRADTLLTVVAVARLLNYASQADPERATELEARFREERAWLDRLATRYTTLPSRPSLFDPSAWYLLIELGQQGLSPDLLTSPLGPDLTTLLRQVFDRNDERIAAALLPEVLPYMERESTALWRNLRQQLPADPALTAVVSALNADWFDPWAAAEPPAPAANEAETDLIAASVENLRAVVGAAMTVGPPDSLRMKRLRFDLLQALPELPGPVAADAAFLLALTSAVEGLYRREYLAFTGTLLWVATHLLLAEPVADVEWRSPVPRLLTELLPGLSNAFAGDFSEVDPRINASLAAVFDVTQYLQSASPAPERRSALRLEVADAVAQLVLLIPDMDYYYEQPVRQRIAEEVDICLSIMADRDERGEISLSRQQFDGCLESLVGMANELAGRAELAGDADGPFATEQLRRELLLTPWQRINYTLGYLHDRHPSGCELPAQPLPNPLEWSSLATVVVWFAWQAPLYLQTPENEARLTALRRSGDELLETWVRQVDCISGAGTGLNDPVVRGLGDYRRALDGLVAGLREAELEFRESRLKPGSDVMLHSDASQRTAFRNEGLAIGPCDTGRVCEMVGRLDVTRALIGLFPDPYLIADQTGLGEIEICYDNVHWVDRRSEPVRPDDPFVANYYGRLSFDLVGRFHEAGETTEVFGFSFVSPGEYHYLFAAATDEVLADDCPVEWVGSRIVTGLGGDGRLRIVPDRLTYLAAARRLPSQVISANWARSEEWRDSFVTGRGVTPHAYEPDSGIVDRVNRHLRALYQEEQSALYNALLRPGVADGLGGENSLYERLEELTVYKSLLRSYMVLFYPQFMLDTSDIRAALEGHDSLLSQRILHGFLEANVAVSSINETGLERLDRLQALWSRQPEVIRRSGSTAVSLAHAMARLDALHDEFFVQPRRTAVPAAVTPAPATAATGD